MQKIKVPENMNIFMAQRGYVFKQNLAIRQEGIDNFPSPDGFWKAN